MRASRYFWSSFSLSESWPCCIRFPTLEETLSTVFFGCWPMRFASSDSLQAVSSREARSKPLIFRSVDKAVPFDPGHHFAEPRADLLDRQLGGHAPLAEQPRRA